MHQSLSQWANEWMHRLNHESWHGTINEYNNDTVNATINESMKRWINGSVSASRGYLGAEAQELIAQIAAIEALDDEALKIQSDDEDIGVLPDGPYKTLLSKYPSLLKQNFNAEATESDVIHRIHTGDAKPFKSRVRKLIPGSPKAKLAKKAWDQLSRLGIVEKVDKSTPHHFISPIHFTPKSDSSLRPVHRVGQFSFATLERFYSPDCWLPHLQQGGPQEGVPLHCHWWKRSLQDVCDYPMGTI